MCIRIRLASGARLSLSRRSDGLGEPPRPELATSVTLTTDFCIGAVEEALARHSRPEIFNTDHGAQFTSADFTSMLHNHGIAISMDGKGCWRDNIFVERLWRSIKYKEVYLHV